MKDILDRWNGRRIGTRIRCCGCGGYDGVLRRRFCRDELELFCDRCETWQGIIVTRNDVRAWSCQSALPSPEAGDHANRTGKHPSCLSHCWTRALAGRRSAQEESAS
jgi:hypothetical protein